MNELIELSLDTENAEKNYNLAAWYEEQGHTAPAHTYYLRASERTTNNNFAYQALIRASFCYKKQGSRDNTEKVLLENALMLLPERPEAYYFLSLLYEKREEWQNCYIYANLGIECYKKSFDVINIPEYSGIELLIFQKAVSSWWWGRGQESRNLFTDLYKNYWKILNNNYKAIIKDNMKKIGVEIVERKIIDCFRFFNEKELLELRYHLLKDKVDKFIILQGTRTFSGNPTELLARKYINELNLPEDKFIVIDVNLPGNDEDIKNSEIDIAFRALSGPSTDTYKNSLNTRTRELMVMDGVTHAFSYFTDDDIFFISDCDEVINPSYIDDIIDIVIQNPDKLVKIPLVELQGKANLKVYDVVNNKDVIIDHVFYCCTKKHFNVCSPSQLRYDLYNPFEILHFTKSSKKCGDCGWHFSWMGDSNRKKIKCKSFSHYSDYIESAVVKDLNSTEMEMFFDEWQPKINGVNPWGNKNLILKKYEDDKLPREIWQLNNVRQFLLGDDILSSSTDRRLVDLFLEKNYDTDKYGLGYITEFYDDVLQSLKNDPINMLEIGTYHGGSAELWKDYFHSQSNIFTGDIVECPSQINGVNYILGDLYSDEIVSNFEDNYFHLIIDDGPHTFHSFESVLEKYYSKLKIDGTLVLEDVINSSYISPLVMLSKEIGYSSYKIIDMTDKQINQEWRNNWQTGLYILRFDK